MRQVSLEKAGKDSGSIDVASRFGRLNLAGSFADRS
jgi:hypothetical protein